MARIRVERSIAADPTSTALLLAGPSGLDLWPNVERVHQLPDRLVAETDVATFTARRPIRVDVRLEPPQRLPLAYVMRFEASGPGMPDTTGVLTLTYEPYRGRLGTSALLRLDYSLATGEGRLLDRWRAASELRGLSETFLDNLATAAESRADAA